MRILVVEDNRVTRLTACRMFERLFQADVDGVDSAEQALKVVHLVAYDLMVVDWRLPGMNGMEFIRHVRRFESSRRVPIFMMTAQSRPEDVLTAVEAGADDFILKPAEMETLVSKVRRHVPVGVC